MEEISKICTRATAPDVDDWINLKRILQLINRTINDKIIIGKDKLNDIVTCIDTAHAIHTNMLHNTGGCIYFGKGVVKAISTKQKPHKRGTRESELVGISKYLPIPI